MRSRALCCVVLAACSTWRAVAPSECKPLAPPPPAPIDAAAPPPTPPSQISIPVTLDLAAVFAAADADAPRAGSSPGWNGDPDGAAGWITDGDQRYRYRWARDPLRIRLIGDELQIHADLRYAIQGEAFVRAPRPLRIAIPLLAFDRGHWIGGTCGDPRAPDLRVAADLHVAYRLRPDWTLEATAAVDGVNAIDPCEIKILKITVENATRKVRDELARVLLAKVEGVAAALRAKDVRRTIAAAWIAFQTPKSIGPGAWVVPIPDAVTMTPLTGSGAALGFVIDIAARFPIQLAGAAPDAPPIPLPDRSETGSLRGFRVVVQGDLPYAAIQEQLDQLAGKTYTVKKHTLRVVQSSIAPAGTGRIRIAIRFETVGGDPLCGTLYLVGTPAYDPIRDVLAFPDLSFDVRTSDLLVNVYAWIKESALVADLRTAARWQTLPVLAGLADKLNAAFAADQQLAIAIESLELGGISAGDAALTVRIVATGSARYQGTLAP